VREDKKRQWESASFLSLLLLCLLALSSSCTVAVRKEPFQWPVISNYLEGTGDMDLSWGGRRFSGSFALTLESPSSLLFEVYGPFGQTLLQLKKNGEMVAIVTSEGKTEGQGFFEDQYGMTVDRFMDDLAMKGTLQQSSEGNYIDRGQYRVIYGNHSGRPRICWLNPQGTLCLTYGELNLSPKGQKQ
jgi:hypothetical protein